MKKFRQARCPHCGKKVSLLRSWAIKTQGEYKCPECGGISNIELDAAIFILAIFAVIMSGIIYIFYMLARINVSLIAIAIIILPYLLFYILCIFLVRLRKPVIRKKPPVNQKTSVQSQRTKENLKQNLKIEQTKVLDNFSQYSK